MTDRINIVPSSLGRLTAEECLALIQERRARRGQLYMSDHLRRRLRGRLERQLSAAGGPQAPGDLPKPRLEALRGLARKGARLAGPGTLEAVDQFAADLHAEAPWLAEASSFVMWHLRQSVSDGKCGLRLPPLLLVGPPGCGKSRFALRMAELGGVPHQRIDVGSGAAGFRISGLEKGWSSSAAGVPVTTVLEHRVANPLFIVDEVDKCGSLSRESGGGTSLTVSLLEMLEPLTAARFHCPSYRLPFDMSHVTWVLTANVLEKVPAPLVDRCRVFHVPEPTVDDLLQVFDRLVADITDPELVTDARRCLAQALAPAGMSLRQLQAYVRTVRGLQSREELH